tara:strand:- start:1920 stop:2261 length:342 start_codon:yes stop_codon:yes gene_type:complete
MSVGQRIALPAHSLLDYGVPPFIRQLANQPVRFQRIVEPGFSQASLDTRSNRSRIDGLALLIEKRQFPARLIDSAPKVPSLRRCHFFCRHDVRNPRSGCLDFLGCFSLWGNIR